MGTRNTQLKHTYPRAVHALLLLVCLASGTLANDTLANDAYAGRAQHPMFKILHVEHSDAPSRTVPPGSRFRDLNHELIPFAADLSDAYWLKPFLANQQEIAAGHLFTLRPITLHRVEMYIPALDMNRPIHSLGRFDVNTSPKFSHHAMVFELPDNYISGQAVFFYIHSRSDEELALEYWEHDAYLVVDRKRSGLQSAMFAGLLVLLLINVIFFIAARDLNYLAYIGYLASVLLFTVMSTGKIYEFRIGRLLAGNYNSTLFVYALTCLTLTVFVQKFLQLKKYTPVFFMLTEIYAAFYSAVLLITLIVWPVPYYFFTVINYSALLPLLFLIYSAFKIALNKHKQALYFLVAFLPLISIIFFRILAVLDYGPNWEFALESFELALIFQVIVLSVGLVDQMLELRKQRDAAQLLSNAATSTLQTEKDFSGFLARIGEEIRAQPDLNHDELIVHSFFNRLKNLYHIEKAAIIYQIDAELKVMSDAADIQSGFNDYINKNISAVSRVCHGVELKTLAIQQHPAFSPLTHMLVIPVHMRGHEWSGMLINLERMRQLDTDQYDVLQRYATEMVRTMANAHNLQHFSVRAVTDNLTQVMNRGAILDVLEKEINAFLESQLPLSIAFLDIDHLKKINDTLGHEAGDTCLSYLALQSRRHLPENASIGRLGGDEFLFVFPNQVSAQAKGLLTALSDSLETLMFDHRACTFTISIGVAQYAYRMDVKEFLRYADETLYKAKKNGRAQIMIAD